VRGRAPTNDGPQDRTFRLAPPSPRKTWGWRQQNTVRVGRGQKGLPRQERPPPLQPPNPDKTIKSPYAALITGSGVSRLRDILRRGQAPLSSVGSARGTPDTGIERGLGSGYHDWIDVNLMTGRQLSDSRGSHYGFRESHEIRSSMLRPPCMLRADDNQANTGSRPADEPTTLLQTSTPKRRQQYLLQNSGAQTSVLARLPDRSPDARITSMCP